VVKESRTSPMTLPTIRGSKGILAIVRGRNKEEERRGSGAKEGRNTIVMMNPAEERECELYIYNVLKSVFQGRVFFPPPLKDVATHSLDLEKKTCSTGKTKNEKSLQINQVHP